MSLLKYEVALLLYVLQYHNCSFCMYYTDPYWKLIKINFSSFASVNVLNLSSLPEFAI